MLEGLVECPLAATPSDVVRRFEIYKKLEKHRGCVNTVSFNYDGDILISGSDDRRVILWDWATGKSKLSFPSGHRGNIFHAKFMPYTDDRSIVTCAADGQVRYAQILESGEVKISLLAKHQGGAHKLAIEPGSPHVFYSCGEDGLVQRFDLRTETATELFTCRLTQERRYTSIIHLNAIAIDPRDPNLFSVAGSDEYARLYDIRKYQSDGAPDFGQPVDYFCPAHLIGDRVGITGLAYSDHSELLASYNDESIYLFTRDMGLGHNPFPPSSKSVQNGKKGETSSLSSDIADKPTPQVYKGRMNCETVKGVGFFGPKSQYVVSGSDCGRIFIWKKKGGELIRVMEADKDVVNCIEAHPHTPVLASSGIENDIKIWTPTAGERAVLPSRIDEVKPKPWRWMHHISMPEELLMQLFSSLHRGRAESDHDADSPTSISPNGRDITELMISYNGIEDSSESDAGEGHNDDGESEEGGDEGHDSGPEDFFS
ncbi:hypothetical protein SAY86_021491 [Trapa natans]|uniref:Uncharacterized protein n=1 Tax=Trapa natans TaxID=22666 RepID=A0AAN7RD41_TRANT|nr:hypothetical protein SAY86_021491 [Trapa natans]